MPWEVVHLDCAGPWDAKFHHANAKKSEKAKVLTLTAIDKGTNYPEIWPLHNKKANTIAKKFDAGWLCRHPRPVEVRTDNGGEFNGFEFQELCHSHGIKVMPTTVKNPEANAIIERLHLGVGDVLRMTTFKGDS